RPHTSRAQIVLERNRHAHERLAAPPIEVPVDLLRTSERLVARDGVERVQRRVDFFETLEGRGAGLGRGLGAAAHAVSNIADRRRLVHPMTRGTLNSPAVIVES